MERHEGMAITIEFYYSVAIVAGALLAVIPFAMLLTSL